MVKRLIALVFIFLCTSAGWAAIGHTTSQRTDRQDMKLKEAVGELWGTVQVQRAPELHYLKDGQKPDEPVELPLTLAGSDIGVDIYLEHRKKGLLWYSTYAVALRAKYIVENTTDKKRDVFFRYDFPSDQGVYDGFRLAVNGEEMRELDPQSGTVQKKILLEPGEKRQVEISYKTHGMDRWWYRFGYYVSQVRDFTLVMTTDFRDIDFPANSISPTRKEKTQDGWKLAWEYDNLISGIQIGMEMPHKLNPGPFITKVSLFAPVSLFLFLFLMFLITTVRRIEIHPMNYFFISASFFSFHLLMAYLADHVDIHLAFAISAAVSVFLVISYMRLVAGVRFALFETGLSQVVYLVLFAYSFFLEGYTGLAITLACILTLFVVMQLTGRVDWKRQLAPATG